MQTKGVLSTYGFYRISYSLFLLPHSTLVFGHKKLRMNKLNENQETKTREVKKENWKCENHYNPKNLRILALFSV